MALGLSQLDTPLVPAAGYGRLPLPAIALSPAGPVLIAQQQVLERSLAPLEPWFSLEPEALCSIARVILAFSDEQIDQLVASGQFEEVSKHG